MRRAIKANRNLTLLILGGALVVLGVAYADDRKKDQESGKRKTSYAPVVINEDFATVMARMKAAKPEIMERQMALLKERYDLENRAAEGVTMSRGKAVQDGV